MATELERLQVVIDATTAPFKDAINEAKSAVSRFQAEIKGSFSGKNSLEIKPEVNTDEPMSRIEKLKLMLKSSIADIKVGTGLFDYTDEFKKMTSDISQTESQIRTLEIAMEDARNKEGPDSESFLHFSGALDDAKMKLGELNNAAVSAIGSGAITAFKGFAVVVKGVGTAALSAAKGLGQLAANGIEKAAGAFGALIKKMFSANSLLGRFGGGTKNLGLSAVSLSGAFKKMLRYGFGIRSLYALVNKIRRAVIDGFQNMAKAMPGSEISRNVNMVSSSFSQLKSSVAAAAAPLFNALAPALNSIIQIAIKAANAVGMFLAALTGKKFKAASAGASNAANNISNVGSAADDANDSAKKLKRTLMSFDEINKLDDNDDSGSSGGSGGGSGGGGGIDYGGFEDMPISQNIKDFVDKLKEAWEKADFTEIGQMLGNKLNEAMENIPWDKIKETARKIAKSIATFLNGFIEAVNWELVGKTLAEGLNTVIEFAYTFITTFNWKKFGEAIGRAINGFVDNIDTDKLEETGTELGKGIADALNGALEKTDWKKVGNTFGSGVNTVINTAHSFVKEFKWKTLGTSIADFLNGAIEEVDFGKAGDTFSRAVKGILDAAKTAVEETDWEKLGEKIGEFLKNVDWIGILSKVGELICDAIIAAMDFTEGFTKSIADGLKDVDPEKLKGDAKNLLDKIMDVNTKIEDIKIRLVKFGWETISKFVGDAVSVAISLAKKAWTSIKDFVGDTVSVAVSLAKKAWTSIKDFVGDAVSVAVKLGKEGWSSISSFVGTSVKTSIKLAKDGWKSISSFVGDSVKASVSLAKRGWSSISSFVGTSVTTKISLAKKGWSSLSKWVGTTVTVGIKLAKHGWSSLSKWVGSLVKVGIKLFKKAMGGVYQNGHWSPVHHYASGGSPDGGQMFIAREAGPELVGTLGRHTAVMNNNQIVSSVAAGVYRAVLAAMSANEGNGITEVHVHLEGDAKKMFKVVQTEADNYLNSTGLSPFPI